MKKKTEPDKRCGTCKSYKDKNSAKARYIMDIRPELHFDCDGVCVYRKRPFWADPLNGFVGVNKTDGQDCPCWKEKP